MDVLLIGSWGYSLRAWKYGVKKTMAAPRPSPPENLQKMCWRKHYAKHFIVVNFSDFFEMFEMLFSRFFSPLFPDIEGSHLSKKVREMISMTQQCLSSLFLSVAPSYVENNAFEKYEVNDD